MPEMLRMWHVFADVKTAADLDLPVPVLAERPGDDRRVPETSPFSPPANSSATSPNSASAPNGSATVPSAPMKTIC